jgi:uncharacterized protein
MPLPELSSTPRTELKRHRERGRTSRDDLYAVLDAGLVCHLAVVTRGAPRVLPIAYGRAGETLYLHGSTGNAAYLACDGQEVCVAVTHLDGLVFARSVFSHSMNYRCAMIFGIARKVEERSEKLLGLRAVTEQMAVGQWDYARQPTPKELAATAVLALPLAEASVKIRAGGPVTEPEDALSEAWAGVVPVTMAFGEPVPDAALRPGTAAPGHIYLHRE